MRICKFGRRVRVRHEDGCHYVEKCGPRRVFGLMPGHWHTIERFRSPFDAVLLASEIKSTLIRDRFES